MFKRIWNWLYISSKNPANVSLTIKGVIVGIIPILIAISPMFGIKLDSSTLGDVAGSIEGIINAVLTIFALAMTLCGLVRKVYNTLSGNTTQQS